MGLSGSKKMLKETGTGVSGGSSSNPTTIGSSNTNSSSGFPPATPAQGNSKLATGLEMYYGPFRLLANFAANNTYLPFSLGVEKQTQRALAQREGFTRALGNQGFLKALKNQALGFAKLSKPLTAAQNFGTQNLNGINNSMDFQKDAGQVKEQSFNNNLNKLFTLTGDYAKHKLLNLQGSFPSGSLFPPGPSATANSSKNSILNVLKDQPENALGQRLLKREYLQDRVDSNTGVLKHVKLNKVTKTGNKLSKYSPNPLKRSLGKLDLDSYASMPFGPMGTNQDLSGSLSMANGGLDSLNSYNRKVATKAGNTMGATMSQEEESKKVFVIINSFGGSVGNGITVHDALQFIKAGSLTLGLGVAASAASLVLAGGTIGERYVTEGCHVMIHQPEGGLNGQASDIWIDANEIMKIRLDVAEIYSLSTYRPRHKILRDLDRDFYLTATETISYGLADEIATNEVMSQIVEMTSKAWYEADAQQQRLLESVAHRVDRSSGLDTGSQAAP